ncbi:MAG: acyl-CoA dehydrogenase family protein, partial [Alphaproteobacteria bacterium]
MQITYTPQEDAFRAEIRAFVQAECDPAARERVQKGLAIKKEDYVNWHKKLATKGWAVPHWPV